MKTKIRLGLMIATLALSACVTPFRSPPDVAHIKLSVGHSAIVHVEKLWLERKDGPLVVRGYVLRRLDAGDTSATHLDVTAFDASGRVIRQTIEHFEPRQIQSRATPRHRDASYRIPLDPLPANTAAIEVRAHDGDHGV